ncbi:uncharacterized protein [Triticum aestivum]|uniref:uncharacterized protein isoform X1 n=1 Tax=Triticum aestivum TaxID=4565 RepID=UPI001D02EFAF|nr:uncharacterized protein LOC123154228 isoform X1 [Triticum aestivum]
MHSALISTWKQIVSLPICSKEFRACISCAHGAYYIFSIPQPRWAGGGGYGEGRSSCCGWCRRKWWMLTMLSHGGKVILKNHYLVKTLTIHSAQQQVSRPRWFMDPRSRCTDCSLKPMNAFEDAHMVYILMKEA